MALTDISNLVIGAVDASVDLPWPANVGGIIANAWYWKYDFAEKYATEGHETADNDPVLKTWDERGYVGLIWGPVAALAEQGGAWLLMRAIMELS
ncbi:hypothetical protein CMO91_01675 [Candidatus Woesearchaeota archaeon]|nr:hypothetical protein [Candidatus Woesearchaeota archaeon]|tara:strand:- start:481 stop:765 length:285 start_codon:yes stop_codon:yes gene_type:complete